MLRSKKGFTLIEIIVVVVIISVLMAVAVPSVMSYISEGNNAKYESVARAALINLIKNKSQLVLFRWKFY